MTNAKDIYILGIESSCDETASSVVKNGRVVLSNVISSQIELHKKYGGVVPEVASRKHVDNISLVVDEALLLCNKTLDQIDAIAVTYGPGLIGALLVGLSYAKALSYALKKPLVGVHHIEGHICANYINNNSLKPPFICLIASGGHTHLVLVKDYGEIEILGRTRDDAAGEAYDKIARAIGLSYPGGPAIDKLAKFGNPKAISFPKANLKDAPFDFSFSGLKSSVLNYLNKSSMMGQEVIKEDVAAAFQNAVVEVLVEKSIAACKEFNIDTLCLAGGVASNSGLRESLAHSCIEANLNLNIPEPIFCTDNAAMIASCGYFNFINGLNHPLNLNAYSNLAL